MLQQQIEQVENGKGGKCSQHRSDGTMDDEHGYLDVSEAERSSRQHGADRGARGHRGAAPIFGRAVPQTLVLGVTRLATGVMAVEFPIRTRCVRKILRPGDNRGCKNKGPTVELFRYSTREQRCMQDCRATVRGASPAPRTDRGAIDY